MGVTEIVWLKKVNSQFLAVCPLKENGGTKEEWEGMCEACLCKGLGDD